MNAKYTYTPFQQKLYEALFEARTSTNDLEALVERYTLPLYGIILREVEIRLTALEDKVEEMQQKHVYTCSGNIHDETDALHNEEIEIPFGARDSELQEARYYIPEGFHAEIIGNEVVIKKGGAE